MKKSEKLTQKELKKLLHYDPDTGIFRWKVTIDTSARKGNIAGGIESDHYVQIWIKPKNYKGHRLAWLYYYGYFPENDIDHEDQIKHHNWITNLREVTRQCNMRNQGNIKSNTSGVKGVSWSKIRNEWEVYVWINNKKRGLGYYKNFDNAVCARLAGEQCLDWNGCDKNSPAFQYVQKMLKPKKRRLPKIIV